MIYDKEIIIAALPENVGTPIQGKLQRKFLAFCGEKEVYHRRYWEAVQAGSRVDLLVELPLHRAVDAGMYALYKGRTYSIEQAQFGADANGLPITTLSLMKTEAQYEIE